MYKNYIFDFYGTLVDIHTDESKGKLWKNLSKIMAMYGAKYKPNELEGAYVRFLKKAAAAVPSEKYTLKPEPQLLDVFRNMYAQRTDHVPEDIVRFTAVAFRALSTDYIKKYDGVDELLDEIRRNGGKIYLLSNAQRVFTEPEMRMVGLDDKFDDIFISSDFGCAKPDPLFFGALMQKHRLEPKETIFIGNDFSADIQGAYDVGLDSLYVHTSVSPEVRGPLRAKYSVMDGDLNKVRRILFQV